MQQSCEHLVLFDICYHLASVYNISLNSGFNHIFNTCVVSLMQYYVLMVQIQKSRGYVTSGYRVQGISNL